MYLKHQIEKHWLSQSDTLSVMKPTTLTKASGQKQHCSMEGVKMQWGGRKGLLRGKKKLRSPLLLSLIKFSALITIKPLSMYNNVCITEQHRCSPSTQLNIKMAVAVLIATWCASHFVPVCVCICVCVYKPSHCRGDSLDTAAVAWRPTAPSLVPPVSPLPIWPIFTAPLSVTKWEKTQWGG